MFRLFFTYVLPLILPALLHFPWLRAARHRVPTGKASAAAPGLGGVPWVLLAAAGVSLWAVTPLALTGYHGKPGRKHVPPRLESGKIVPGEDRR